MPLIIRSIRQRIEQIISDLQNATQQTIPPIEESWDRTWATVNGGMAKTIELGINRAARDMLPGATNNEEVLSEYAGWGNTPRGEEQQAILNATGTGVPGEVIGGGISGIQYVSDDGQKFYFADDVTIPPSGSFAIQVTAFLPGAQANLKRGTLAITGQDPNISGVLTIVESDPIVREGRDQQVYAAWRTDVNRSLQRPILADNYSYFYETTRQTPGGEIVAGYAYTGRPGQMELYVRSRGNNGIPTELQKTNVQDWYDGTADGVVRIPPHYEGFLPDEPETSRFPIFGCTNTLFAVRVTGMLPNTEVTQTVVGQDIIDYFETREPYIRGVSISNNGLLDVKALTSIVQNRVESGDIQTFTSVEYSLAGGAFNPQSQYALGRGELCRTTASEIEWPES